jgi:hypothetical protein
MVEKLQQSSFYEFTNCVRWVAQYYRTTLGNLKSANSDTGITFQQSLNDRRRLLQGLPGETTEETNELHTVESQEICYLSLCGSRTG